MQGKFAFWVKVLSCLVAGLLVSTIFLPMGERSGDWIPLFSGYLNLTPLMENSLLSGILGGLFIILIGISLLLINNKVLSNLFYPPFTVLFYLLLTLLNPDAIYFSGLHIAVLLFVWGQYCFITNQKFTAMFLLSASSLFYAPFVWLAPLVMVISLIGAPDPLRTALKSIGGIILPPLYILSFRYMAFGDSLIFLEEFIDKATSIAPPSFTFSGSSLFLMLLLLVILINSVSYMFRRISSVSKVASQILRMEFLCLILAFLVLIFRGRDTSLPINMIAALPMSIFFSNYFTGSINRRGTKMMLFLLSCATVISALSYFM